MKRYISKLSPAINWVKKYYYVVLPVVACLVLVLIFRPWSSKASGPGAGKPGVRTSLAQGKELLVADRAPASAQPVSYEYIMTESQQKRVLKEAPKLKVGDDVKTVIEKLGPPMRDDSSYGQKNAGDPKYRSLNYYFAKRVLVVGNDFDPCLFLVFDEHGKLFAMASNVADIPEINWGTGVTAYHGVTH